MKKLFAALMVMVILTVGCFSVLSTACAGSIFDTIGSIAKSAVHLVKTAGNGIKGVVLDAFTDTPSDECYKDARNSFDKVKENACDILENGKKIGTDFVDLLEGSKDVMVGAMGAMGTALYETEEWIRTGKKDYSLSGAFVDTMKAGYKKADNGIFTDLAIIATTACGVPSYAVGIGQFAKSGVEWAAGYKDMSTAGREMITSGVSAITGGVCNGMDLQGFTDAAVKFVTGTATQITLDMNNSKDDRSALDIVLEDAAVSAAKIAALKGVGKAGEAVRGNNASDQNAEQNANQNAEQNAAQNNAQNADPGADNASNVAVDNASANANAAAGNNTGSANAAADNNVSIDSGVNVPVENEA